MSWLAAFFMWQTRAVVARTATVHLRNWNTAFLPPMLEPVLFLLAFGIGLGLHVSGIPFHGIEVPYLAYIAPGMLAYTAFITALFQSLWGSYVRMIYQKTWEGQLCTQIELRHVIAGEILWAALMAASYVVIVAVVIIVFQGFGQLHLQLAWLPLAIALSALAAITFATIGLWFTSLVPSIDFMNLPMFLFALPIAFLSNTYFPLPTGQTWIMLVVQINPVYHLAESNRALLLGHSPGWHPWILIGECALIVGLLVPRISRTLRRRMLGE